MHNKIKKAARVLFMTALLASFMLAGATPTHAWLKYITIEADGSFAAISCGTSAGPTAIVYIASTGQTHVLGAAQPSQCETNEQSPEEGPVN